MAINKKSDWFLVEMQVSVVIYIFLVHLLDVGALGFALRRGGGSTDDKLNGGRGGVILGQMQDN